MKHFSRSIFAAALIGSSFAFLSLGAAAQNSNATQIPNPTAAVPPVTIQSPVPAPSNAPSPATPAPAALDQQPTSSSAPPVTQPRQTKKTAAAKKHGVKKTHHVHKKIQHHKANKKSSVSSTHERTKTAQNDLELLNYNPGPIDGLIGPKTRAALKAFQKDSGFKVTGKLDAKTYDLLVSEAADALKKKETPQMSDLQNGGEVAPGPKPTPDFYVKHPDYYGYTNREYTNPNQLGSPQSIPTRFGDMAIDDHMTGTIHEYSITINGHPVFRAEGQPSVINLSRTFPLEEADAVVLTSYAENDTTCPYRHYLLVIRLESNGVHEIGNCTRSFEAYTQNGGLYITFPGDHVDGWSSGDTWRYENGTLQRL